MPKARSGRDGSGIPIAKVETFDAARIESNIGIIIGLWTCAALVILIGTWQAAYAKGLDDKAAELSPVIAAQVQRADAALASEAFQVEALTTSMNNYERLQAENAAYREDNRQLTRRLRARWIANQPKPRGTYTRSNAKPVNGWSSAGSSWYGPHFYGHTMAGGGTLTKKTMGVAHRSLPFGTRVQFRNPRNGRTVTVTVTDRGPYVSGRMWDLCPGTARALGMYYTATIQYRILGR